jgi:hypothetical protein
MRSTISIDVDAPVEIVFRLTRNVDRWDRLLPHYERSRRIGRGANGSLVCEFVARRPLVPFIGLGLPVAWRSRTWSEPPDGSGVARLRFVHVGGATAGMDVTWRIEPRPSGCRIAIDHDFRREWPVIGERLVPAFVNRYFTRPIAQRTLSTFAAIAEALTDNESNAASEAKPSA